MTCVIRPRTKISYDLSELLEGLRSHDSAVRALAARDLGEAGDLAALPALLDALCDPAVTVRALAAEALGALGDAHAVPPLLQALHDAHEEVRWSVARALQHLGPSALPGLMAALRGTDQAMKQAAAWALREVDSLQAMMALEEWQPE